MAKKMSCVRPVQLDVGEAEQAFQKSLPALEQLARGEIQPVRVDLQLVGAIAYSVAIRDSQPARRARLAALGQSGVFDIAVLDGLARTALTGWHVRRRQIDATEVASDARVPESVLRDAQQIRARMLRVLSYHFEEHEEYGRRILAIRAGAGYVDLANDLLSLAEFYEESDVKSVVGRDPSHYKESDPADARQRAQQLFEGLGIGSQREAARWTDLAQRAWTVLSREYGLLRAAGQLVFRNDEDVELSYPSLVAATRTPNTRPQGQAPEPDPSPPPPAPEPVPPPEPAPVP